MKTPAPVPALPLACILASAFLPCALANTPGSRPVEDLAALSIEDEGIHKLERLLRDHRGTREEAGFLMKLGELQLARAGITFRISEGGSVAEHTPLHERSLRGALSTFNRYLERFPSNREAPLARFRRARTLRELGLTPLARKDDLFLAAHSPDFPLLDSVLMDLANDAQEANRHEEALAHLSRIEAIPHSPLLILAIHKKAWSEFNLGRLDPAIASLHREIALYAKGQGSPGQPDAAGRALRETALKDLALFHFEAIQRSHPGSSIEGTLKDLKRHAESPDRFAMAALHLARFLKAYGRGNDLAWLKKRMEHEGASKEAGGEIALLHYQLQLEQRNWSGLEGIEAVRSGIEGPLTKALADLHKLVLRNKRAS